MRSRVSKSLIVLALAVCAFAAAATTAMAADTVSGNWFGATGPLAPAVKKAGTIESAGDADWYYFYNSAQGQIKVGFNSTNSAYLVLYRWEGGYMKEVDSTSWYGLIDSVMVPGLYYIKVYDSSEAGTYDVTVSGTFAAAALPAGVQPHPSAIPVTEDNLTGWTDAQGPLQPLRPHTASIYSPGDSDWYCFYNSAQGQLRVGFNSSNSAYLELYRWEGGYLKEVESTSWYGLIDEVMVPGLYYIKVYDNSDTGTYDLTVSGTFVTATPPAGVQSRPYATKIAENNIIGESGATGPLVPTVPYVSRVDAAADADWYFFYNVAQGQVKVGFNSTNSAYLELYRLEGGYLKEVESTSWYGLIDGVMVPGLYYIKVYDNSEASNYDVTVSGTYVVSKTPTALSLSAPKTIGYGKSAVLSGILSDVRGTRMGAATVMLQSCVPGAPWSDVRALTTAADGSFSTAMAPRVGTYYRVVYPENAAYGGSGSAALLVSPKVYVTRPATPTTARRASAFTASGYLKPKHASGTYPIKLQCYHYESGRWVYKKTVKARAYNYSTYTKYKCSMSLGSKGKWRIRASHAADTKNALTTSSYRYITVR